MYRLIGATLVSDVNYFGLRDVVRIVIKWIRRLLLFQRRLIYDARALVIGRRRAGSQCGRIFSSTGKRLALLRCVLVFLQRVCLLQTTVLHTSCRSSPAIVSWRHIRTFKYSRTCTRRMTSMTARQPRSHNLGKRVILLCSEVNYTVFIWPKVCR
jgi:hypothetical protein